MNSAPKIALNWRSSAGHPPDELIRRILQFPVTNQGNEKEHTLQVFTVCVSMAESKQQQLLQVSVPHRSICEGRTSKPKLLKSEKNNMRRQRPFGGLLLIILLLFNQGKLFLSILRFSDWRIFNREWRARFFIVWTRIPGKVHQDGKSLFWPPGKYLSFQFHGYQQSL